MILVAIERLPFVGIVGPVVLHDVGFPSPGSNVSPRAREQT